MSFSEKLQTPFAKDLNEVAGIASNLLALFIKADDQLISPFTATVLIDSMANTGKPALQAEIDAGLVILKAKVAALVGPTL